MNHRFELMRSITCAADDLFQRLAVGPPRPGVALIMRESPPPAISDPSPPRYTVFGLDVSGSMGAVDYPPSRLDGGISATIAHNDARTRVCPGDRIAIVSFSDVARVVLPLTPIANRRRITWALRRLTASGGTHIAAGLQAIARIFENKRSSGRQRHAILLTDGHGGEPLEEAKRLKEELRVVVDVVGIGGSPNDVNEELLRQVATTDPDGFCHYRFIDDPQTLSEHYSQLAQTLFWHEGRK